MPTRTQGEGGYIKIYRSIVDWEWFQDHNTLHLWIYILLRANYEPSRFMGMKIQRGEMIESLAVMAENTGLTINEVRTALRHLNSTGEITSKGTRFGTRIKVHKYAMYQGSSGGESQTD